MPAVHDRGGVEEEGAHRHGETEHVDRGQVGRVGRERLERLPLGIEKGPPLHQVFGRVAAEHLLGERTECDLGGGHLTGGLEHTRPVGAHGADGGTETGHRQLHESHASAYRVPPARPVRVAVEVRPGTPPPVACVLGVRPTSSSRS